MHRQSQNAAGIRYNIALKKCRPTYVSNELTDYICNFLRSHIMVVTGEERDLLCGVMIEYNDIGEHVPELLLDLLSLLLQMLLWLGLRWVVIVRREVVVQIHLNRSRRCVKRRWLTQQNCGA